MKKNLLTSLKQLLKALGGNDSNKTNIVGVVDEITEQVNNKDSNENNGYSNIVFDPDNYPKPVIDGVECEQIWVKIDGSITSIPARIADIEIINDLPPLCTFEDDGSWSYRFINYELYDVEAPNTSEVNPSPGRGKPVTDPEPQACLKENITIIFAVKETVTEQPGVCALFPSDAKFEFAYIDSQ